MKYTLFILTILLTCCKTSVDNNSQRTLIGQWRVDKIVSEDSTWTDERPNYNSVPYDSGSLFYRAKELNAVIALGDNGQLKTKLMFTTFGIPTWTTNKNMDSLTLKLTGVREQSLIADGTVDKNGEMYLYEGQIKYIDNENVDWILSDGRTFRLKKENAL